TAIEALLLLPLAGQRGTLRPLAARRLMLGVFTGIGIAVPWWLLAKAEQGRSGWLTALLIAAGPRLGAIPARPTRQRQRFETRTLVGLGLGIAGVAALVGFDTGGASSLAIAEAGGVAVCYAVGPAILARYLSDLPSLGVVAASIGLTALIYAPVGGS